MKAISSDVGVLFLRVFVGLSMLLAHGWPKMMKFEALKEQFPDPFGLGSSLSLGLAIFAEVICSLLLIFGVFTRLAAIPPAITMFVAFFVIHAEDTFQKKELALMYLGIYIAIFVIGGGKFTAVKNRNPLLS